MKSANGFTLIELMVTLGMGAVLLVVGVPNFQRLIEKYRVRAQTNRLVGALQLARSEAIKRGNSMRAILCKRSASGGACDNSKAWSDGWLLYIDTDADNTYTAGTDVLIRVYEPVSQFSITTGGNYICWIGFGANGYPIGGGAACDGKGLANDTLRLCANPSLTKKGRAIVINTTGRIRTGDIACS